MLFHGLLPQTPTIKLGARSPAHPPSRRLRFGVGTDRSAAFVERDRHPAEHRRIHAGRHRSRRLVPPEQRIATFDNDGTLWSEQPIYVQFAFALARVKALAPKHPEWKTSQPLKAVLDGDMKALAASGEKGLGRLILATHTGMTTDEFTRTVM